VTIAVLRLAIVGWILLTLARAARGAWAHRRLMTTVWRRIRLRHVLGAAGLLVLVAGTATLLVAFVPGLHLGLGAFLGTSGNAVFTPLEEAVARAGPPPATGPDWTLILLSSGFLLPLAALLPWLAFVEEEVFRAGLEDASVLGELGAALVFGLAHLVMLVPLGAALAVGGAGAVYGRIYRRAYRRSDAADVPPVVLRSYRPTRRARRAADRARTPARVLVLAGAPDLRDQTPERRQAAAVLASTVWHTTFNTLVVLVVWVLLVTSAWHR
jgi:hypothetical protein